MLLQSCRHTHHVEEMREEEGVEEGKDKRHNIHVTRGRDGEENRDVMLHSTGHGTHTNAGRDQAVKQACETQKTHIQSTDDSHQRTDLGR